MATRIEEDAASLVGFTPGKNCEVDISWRDEGEGEDSWLCSSLGSRKMGGEMSRLQAPWETMCDHNRKLSLPLCRPAADGVHSDSSPGGPPPSPENGPAVSGHIYPAQWENVPPSASRNI
jgi:hypothetical protein